VLLGRDVGVFVGVTVGVWVAVSVAVGVGVDVYSQISSTSWPLGSVETISKCTFGATGVGVVGPGVTGVQNT